MIENYKKDEYGIISQIEIKPFDYSNHYVENRYCSPSVKPLTEHMSYLRLGYILGAIGYTPFSLLDVGFGNGEFLKVCNKIIEKTAGYDVVDNPYLPKKSKLETSITENFYDCITFFDSLEHCSDLSFVKDLKCNYVCISVPWCRHYDDAEWFRNWKHRRPDEHIHHFNSESLNKFMKANKFELICYGNVEDTIRKSDNDLPNILTMIFRKSHHLS